MAWQIQCTGSKAGVTKAVNAERSLDPLDAPSLTLAKDTIGRVLERLDPTHTGARVLAAGHGEVVLRLEVEGQFLAL